MDPSLDIVTGWIADRLIAGSLIGALAIALVWMICRRVPSIPAGVQASLWWLVSLKLVLTLVPVVPSIQIPILPPAVAPVVDAPLAVDAAEPALPPTFVADTDLRALPESEGAPTASIASVPALDQQAPQLVISWRAVPIAIWLLAIAAQLVRLLLAQRALRRVVRRARHIAGYEVETSQLASLVGLRAAPAVLESDEIDAPQVVGCLRPIVLLPSAPGLALTAGERRLALAHELMHVRRRDLMLGWIPAVAERLFFFHPLARIAAREYVTAREAACDASVVRALQADAADYGRLLVRLGITRAQPALAASGSSSSASSLRRRLDMLQQLAAGRTPRRSLWWLVIALAFAAAPFELVARSAAAQEPATAAPVVIGPVAPVPVAAPAAPQPEQAPVVPVRVVPAPAAASRPRPAAQAVSPAPAPTPRAVEPVTPFIEPVTPFIEPAQVPPASVTPVAVVPRPAPAARARPLEAGADARVFIEPVPVRQARRFVEPGTVVQEPQPANANAQTLQELQNAMREQQKKIAALEAELAAALAAVRGNSNAAKNDSQLALAQAQLEAARRELERAENLKARKLLAETEAQKAAVAQAEATVERSKAVAEEKRRKSDKLAGVAPAPASNDVAALQQRLQAILRAQENVARQQQELMRQQETLSKSQRQLTEDVQRLREMLDLVKSAAERK